MYKKSLPQISSGATINLSDKLAIQKKIELMVSSGPQPGHPGRLAVL